MEKKYCTLCTLYQKLLLVFASNFSFNEENIQLMVNNIICGYWLVIIITRGSFTNKEYRASLIKLPIHNL